MKKSDLMEWEKIIMEEVVKRRKLGGYSPDAEGILLVLEAMMRLLQHTIENTRSQEELDLIDSQMQMVKARRKAK